MKITLDLRGLKCPLPVLRTHKALKEAPTGSTISVLSDDDGSPRDFHRYCLENSARLLKSARTDDGYEFLLEKIANPD